jgi:hypothetical protein
MGEDYSYKSYLEVEHELIENNYKKIALEFPKFSKIIDRYENWFKGNDHILLEVFKDGYVAIYKDSENI